MIRLNSETFHKEAKKGNKCFICMFYCESKDNLQEIVLSLFKNDHQTIWGTIGYLNTDNAPEIVSMFGLDTTEPSVLIMRNQVVLFHEPISVAEKMDIISMTEAINKLNMNEIKNEIETEKQSTVHLFGRRVCPTAKRIPHDDK